MKVKKLIKFLKTVPKDYDVIADDVHMSDYDRTVTFVNDSKKQAPLVDPIDVSSCSQIALEQHFFVLFIFISSHARDSTV